MFKNYTLSNRVRNFIENASKENSIDWVVRRLKDTRAIRVIAYEAKQPYPYDRYPYNPVVLSYKVERFQIGD